MDDSIRADVFNDMPSVHEYAMKWKKICYMVVAFEAQGEVFLYNDTLNKLSQDIKDIRNY